MISFKASKSRHTPRLGIFLFCISSATFASEAEEPDPLLGLFPDSGAPTFFEKKSELVLERGFRAWERNSDWHPDLDEKTVYHCRMQHQSCEERNWEIGIGKGGQIYSMTSSFGEAMPPQSPEAPWMDEAWQMTTIYENLLGRDLPNDPPEVNAFIHQSGNYIRGKETPSFYSPMLAEGFHPERRAFSTLCWAQIPTASINRSGVLIYAQYRDLGAGVVEVTWLVTNFESEPLTNLGPWGGVRTSKFPEHVLANPDGTYRYFTPFSFGSPIGYSAPCHETGGWAAATQNAASPDAYAIGLVFGKNPPSDGNQYRPAIYTCGDSRHGKRDYTVQAPSIYMTDHPGDVHLYRMYFVIGTLADAAKKCNQLTPFARYQQLRFAASDSPRVPLYSTGAGSSATLTRKPQKGMKPVAHAWVYPVAGSKPLFLIREKETGHSFITTDPYAGCAREPFRNPASPDARNYEKYQNRTLYKTYAGKTEWLELLGFAVTDPAIAGGGTRLSEIPAMTQMFQQAEGVPAEKLYLMNHYDKGTGH